MLLKGIAVSFFIGFSEASIQGGVDIHKETNCTPSAIYEFPNDGFTKEQRQSGWITIHVLLTVYCFIALSIVCDDFFVPAIQTLVRRLKLSEDVAGASFMAITSASPELFINSVGTFITEGDIGVGTVVGSNVFNILAIPACCGLFTNAAFSFECFPILRDGLTYAIAVVMLIAILYDDRVYWYEAMFLVLAYVLYIAVMYFSRSIQKTCCTSNRKSSNTVVANHELEKLNNDNRDTQDEPRESETNSAYWKIIFCPMRYTIPKGKRLYFLTLLMCMVWIGTFSYVLAWLITAIGDTISIPDSVMGLSFLAVGSSMPEIVSCIIVSRQGQGVMGMSSALGANTFEVLLCLGLPWLIKTAFYKRANGESWIKINSSGLAYNATCLLSTLIVLYICLICNRFRLDRKIGTICLFMYAVFLVVGSLIELNAFFPVNLPICP